VCFTVTSPPELVDVETVPVLEPLEEPELRRDELLVERRVVVVEAVRRGVLVLGAVAATAAPDAPASAADRSAVLRLSSG
jgi:hypothetical protein